MTLKSRIISRGVRKNNTTPGQYGGPRRKFSSQIIKQKTLQTNRYFKKIKHASQSII